MTKNVYLHAFLRFNEVADDRLATEVAKELGYKVP